MTHDTLMKFFLYPLVFVLVFLGHNLDKELHSDLTSYKREKKQCWTTVLHLNLITPAI